MCSYWVLVVLYLLDVFLLGLVVLYLLDVFLLGLVVLYLLDVFLLGFSCTVPTGCVPIGF